MDFVFDKLIVCLDMAGCPNRCRHCWLGHAPNKRMAAEELERAAEAFRPYAKKIEMVSWYREPDWRDDYKELWALEERLSDEHTPHFELMSYNRAAHDASYIPWLAERGVRATQMTFFGGREMTDRYYQRKGAYDELVSLIQPLRAHGITPRFQTFLNKETVEEMGEIVKLAKQTGLADDPEFRAFVHCGGCDGANEDNYPIWATREDVDRLPREFFDWTQQHLGVALTDWFGKTEREHVADMLRQTQSIGWEPEKETVLYVDHEFNVYPNLTAPQPTWRLGNLKTDGAEKVLENLVNAIPRGLWVRKNVPVCELARAHGDAGSERLFDRDDYLTYLVNKYARMETASLSS